MSSNSWDFPRANRGISVDPPRLMVVRMVSARRAISLSLVYDDGRGASPRVVSVIRTSMDLRGNLAARAQSLVLKMNIAGIKNRFAIPFEAYAD